MDNVADRERVCNISVTSSVISNLLLFTPVKGSFTVLHIYRGKTASAASHDRSVAAAIGTNDIYSFITHPLPFPPRSVTGTTWYFSTEIVTATPTTSPNTQVGNIPSMIDHHILSAVFPHVIADYKSSELVNYNHLRLLSVLFFYR